MLKTPLWNIRNKLCEATTKLSLARNVEEEEFWCRKWDQGFQNGKLPVWNVYLHRMFQILSLETGYKLDLSIFAVYGCRNKFRYFPLSSLPERSWH